MLLLLGSLSSNKDLSRIIKGFLIKRFFVRSFKILEAQKHMLQTELSFQDSSKINKCKKIKTRFS